MTHLFGIRHHGPGSANALLKALESLSPDCLLVEAPADAEALAIHVAEPEMKPPVAMLVYNPKDIGQASYFPMAEFSPEWQAIRFAHARSIPVRFMDLPMSLNFAVEAAEKAKQQTTIEILEKLSPEERELRRDPMAHLARIAGYDDSERWWEITFEAVDNQSDIFEAIIEMTTALRAEGRQEEPETLLREAYMRQCIRQAGKDGFQKIAIVCGAWHAPALHDFQQIKASHDAALLKGIKKVNTTATWIPWSYDRLTFQSGYRAGVISPAWYELLFSQPKEAATRWMINVARLFRTEDLDASSAHVIEAIRLSETLATLRGLPLPGIDEMKEAAITTICDGHPERLQFIEEKLITGQTVGVVPGHLKVPAVPLFKDIEQLVKSARLTSFWENTEEGWLGGVDDRNRPKGIDIREDSGKLKSQLLHRLNLLDIPWGTAAELDRHQSAGGFKEFWRMKWSPEFSIRIIEKGAWGNTLEEAATRFLQKKVAGIDQLPALTALVGQTLDAQLPQALSPLLEKLASLAALTTDVFDLMDALPSLARVVRYGDTRGTDVEAVRQVVQHMAPRICIGLPNAVVNLDEDASIGVFKRLLTVNQAFSLMGELRYLSEWYGALEAIANSPVVNSILAGGCSRLLFDKRAWDKVVVETRMRYALSRANPPIAAAQWLEGFLQGSGLLLLHNHALWNLLDAWVDELREEDFPGILPLLRRTFSRFPQPEREQMLFLAKEGPAATPANPPAEFDAERAGFVLPALRRLLGMEAAR